MKLLKRKKSGRKLLSFFLTLAMVVGLMPGMSLTAYAVASPSVAQVTSALSGSGNITDSYNTYFPGFAEVTEEEAKAWTGAPTTGNSVLFFKFDDEFGIPYRAVFENGVFSNVVKKQMTVDGFNESLVYVPAYYTTGSGSSSVAVTNVSLSPTTATLTAGGDAVALTATVLPAEATDKTVKLSVVGDAVKLYSDVNCTTEIGTDATETLTVYVKPISAGDATVTVTSNADSSKYAECIVTVNEATVAVTGVTISPNTTQTIDVDAVVSFTATVEPSTATNRNVIWSSYDTGKVKLYKDAECKTEVGDQATDVLTVYAKGISAGSTTIEVTSEEALTLYAPCNITVNTPANIVTYKVVNGTWSDGSTEDKTETVQSGSKPASVPTGMKASEGYTDGAWDTDPTNATITGATTFTYTFTAVPTYTVTYKVVNGTWSDGSTADKTESVQNGSKPASVPTGMKASEGYTDGAWDTNPADATITGATTFTYTFTAVPTYTVTYKVVNGTWSDGSTADKTETVQSGSKPASVPTGMKASEGYTGGAWDTNPADATITEATTFIYTFTALPTYEVTYKIVNGTWSDDSTTDKTETVQSGSKPTSVPTGMKASEGYTGGGWDTNPAEATITGATTFTYTFTALPTYEVTYKIVNGTWSDGTTADKTETVQSGSKPASVPTGMKASEGYTGGAWDTNPADATITEATTFTYNFTALPTYEVTYKVVNGTWSDSTTADKTETVQSGSKPASVPIGMKASEGYTGGTWDTNPAEATITGATTFTYTFTAIPIHTVTVTNDGHGTGSATPTSGVEGTEITLKATPAEGYAFKEWQVISGGVTVTDNKFTIGTANVEIKAVFKQNGDMEDEVIVEPGAPAVSGTNIDEVAAGVVTEDEIAAGVKVWVDISPLAETAVPAGDKALAGQAMQGFGGTAGAWVDMSMFKQVAGQSKTEVHQTATAFRFSMKVPNSLKKAGRTFWLLRLHDDKADILATTTGDTLNGETNLFSTYLIAYKDAETPTPTPKPIPKTGDQDHPGLWIILMLIGIAGLTVLGTLKASRKRK